MKEMPVKVRVVKSQLGMQGEFAIVVVVEGFTEKKEAEEHSKFLGKLIGEAGVLKAQFEHQVADQEKKQTRHIKLLTDK